MLLEAFLSSLSVLPVCSYLSCWGFVDRATLGGKVAKPSSWGNSRVSIFIFFPLGLSERMLPYFGYRVKAWQDLSVERALAWCVLVWCVCGVSLHLHLLTHYSTSVLRCAWSPQPRNPLFYSQRINLQSFAGMGRN